MGDALMKHVIPFGDRILVRRKEHKEVKAESVIVLPDTVDSRDTDMAVVIYIPELSFIDKALFDNIDDIIEGQLKTAKEGNPNSLDAMTDLNLYLKLKSLKVGDEIFIGKYCGTTFEEIGNPGKHLTMLRINDIIGIVVDV